MSSTQIRQMGIATETTFCGLSSSSAVPTDAGLSYDLVDFLDVSQIFCEGEVLADDPSAARGGGYTLPMRPLSNNGNANKRGSFSFDFYLRPWDLTATRGIPALLKTRFGFTSASGSSTVSTISGNAVTTAAACGAALGGICACTTATPQEIYGVVCDYTSATSFTVTPKLGQRGVATSDAVKCCPLLSLPTSGLPTSTATVAIKISGATWQQILYGCTLTSLSMSGSSDSRGVRCSATVDVAYIGETFNANTVNTIGGVTSDGTLDIFHQLSSPIGLGAAYDLSDGFASGEDAALYNPAPCVDEWTLNIDFTTAFSNCGNYVVGRGPAEVTDLTSTLELTFGGQAAIDSLRSQWLGESARTVVIGFSSPNGAKAAVAMPSAVITDGLDQPDLSGDMVKTKVTFSAGPCPTTTIGSLLIGIGEQP